MGCGASSKEGRGRDNRGQAKYKCDKEERAQKKIDDERETKAENANNDDLDVATASASVHAHAEKGHHKEEAESKATAAQAAIAAAHCKEAAWHRKHCTDNDLLMAHRMDEAYPFDESKTHDYKKEELVAHGSDHRTKEWGHVKVANIHKKVKCTACKQQIVDRHESAPFFFCLRCRKTHAEKGHFVNLCIACFNADALATGPRDRIAEVFTVKANHLGQAAAEVAIRGHAATDTMTLGKEQAHSSLAVPGAHGQGQARGNPLMALHGSGLPNPSPRRGSSQPSPSSSPRPSPGAHPSQSLGPGKFVKSNATGKPHAEIPSGLWKGKVSEGGAPRPTQYQLFVDQSGQVDGHGPENCQVKGMLSGHGTATKVKWTESYDWGTITVTGDLHVNDGPVQLKGHTKSSDSIAGTKPGDMHLVFVKGSKQ